MKIKPKTTLLTACALVLTACGGDQENDTENKTVVMSKFELPTAAILVESDPDHGSTYISDMCAYSAEDLKSYFSLPDETRIEARPNAPASSSCTYSLQNMNNKDTGPMQNFHAEIVLSFNGVISDYTEEKKAETLSLYGINSEPLPGFSDLIYKSSHNGRTSYFILTEPAVIRASVQSSPFYRNMESKDPVSPVYELDEKKFEALLANFASRLSKT